jgi:glycosyltransferase involved in cell wall biosynthesis/GT2 family glycosyltransferase
VSRLARTTVVIPAYNAEATLEAAVTSVLRQTDTDVGVVVVDDGSTDGTRRLAHALASRDDRVTVEHHVNKGLAAARNTGIRASQSRFVAFLDSDDLWHPEYLANMVPALQRHPDAGIAFTDAWVFDGRTHRLRRRSAMARQRPPCCGRLAPGPLVDELLQRNFMWVSTTVRRAALERVGLFDESPSIRAAEDYELWLRLAARGYAAVAVPGRLGFYRSHGGQMSRDLLRMHTATEGVMRVARDRLPLTDRQRQAAGEHLSAAQRDRQSFSAPRGLRDRVVVLRHRIGGWWHAAGGPLHWHGHVPAGLVEVHGRDEDRITVLTLIDEIDVGGAEGLAREIACRLDPGRFQVIVCVTRLRPEDTALPDVRRALDHLRDAGVRVVPLGRRSTGSLRAWAPLIRLLRTESVDVLHAHKFGSNAWAAVFGRAFGIPVIIAHEHSWPFEGQLARRLVDRHVTARGTDLYLAVSEDDKRQMIAVSGIRPDRVTVVRNGITSRPEVAARPRERLGLGPRAEVVVAVGLLRRAKAFHILIEATALLARERPDLRTLIAGGPDTIERDEPDRLRRLVAELDLQDAVTLLGTRHDVFDILAAADVAVCCSSREGSPLSVMEYMEAGTPVVASRVGGLPELLEDGVHGRLVAPDDPAALARAIADVLDDPAGAAAMARRARDRRRREFDIDRAVRQVGDLYVELLGRSRRRRPPWAPRRRVRA